jgi:hypothetical protein
MFTNTLLDVVSFSIAIVGCDEDSTLAFFDDLARRLGAPEIHQLPGAVNFGYDAGDPVRAGKHRARFECYGLLDHSAGCIATVAKSDAVVLLADAEGTITARIMRLLRDSSRRTAELGVIVAGPASALDSSALPGAWIVSSEGSSFDVFKTVAKVVLTMHKRGELREYNLRRPLDV